MQATSSTELNGINLAAAPALVQLEDADPPAVSEGSGEAEAYGSDSSEEEDGIVPRISALPADLRHVASLLSDSSAPGSSAPDSRQAQTAGCVRGRKRARGAVLQQRQRRAAPAADGASAAGLAAAGTSEQPWNSPGEDSSANAWRCEACECWVPRAADGQSAWRAHVQGIRHRRQALSLLHTGARGTLLISTFEPAPEPGAAAKLRSKELCAEPGPPGRDGPAAAAPARLSRLHAAATKELLHHAGAGAEYRRLSERLSPQRLALAWPHVCTRLRGEGRAEGAATFIATQPAMVACIAEALPEMAHLDTLIVMATNVPAMDLAATTAAFVLLARAAARAPTLARLELQLGPLLTRGGQQCAPGGAGRESGRLRRVLQALQETLAANGLLRLLVLCLPWDCGDHAESRRALQALAADAPTRRRMALLMALHPRAGAACFPAWLPTPLLRSILDDASPLAGCRLVARGLPAGSSAG